MLGALYIGPTFTQEDSPIMAKQSYHNELPNLVRRYIAETDASVQSRDHFYDWAQQNQGEEAVVPAAKTRYGVVMGALAKAESDLPDWVSKAKNTGAPKKQAAPTEQQVKSTLTGDQQSMLSLMAVMQKKTLADLEAAYKAFAEADENLSALSDALEKAQEKHDEAVRLAFFRFVGSQGQANVGQ